MLNFHQVGCRLFITVIRVILGWTTSISWCMKDHYFNTWINLQCYYASSASNLFFFTPLFWETPSPASSDISMPPRCPTTSGTMLQAHFWRRICIQHHKFKDWPLSYFRWCESSYCNARYKSFLLEYFPLHQVPYLLMWGCPWHFVVSFSVFQSLSSLHFGQLNWIHYIIVFYLYMWFLFLFNLIGLSNTKSLFRTEASSAFSVFIL